MTIPGGQDSPNQDLDLTTKERIAAEIARHPYQILLILLFTSSVLMSLDSGILSMVPALLEPRVGFRVEDLGALFSVFFWTLVVLQLSGLAGWLADRFTSTWTLGIASMVCAVTILRLWRGHSAGALYVNQAMLGLTLSVAYPCYSVLLAHECREEQRGVANALIDAGSKLAMAVSVLLGIVSLSDFGQAALLLALGMLTLFWAFLWLVWRKGFPPRPRRRTRVRQVGLPVLWSRRAWATFVGHFCASAVWLFQMTWLPVWLVRERGLAPDLYLPLTGGMFVLSGATALLAGIASDRWIARGGSPLAVRRLMVEAGLLCSVLVIPMAWLPNATVSLALLVLASALFGAYSANCWAITQRLAPPQEVGRWASLQSGFGNLAAHVAAWVTGLAIESTGRSETAFLLLAVMAVLGTACWMHAVGPGEPAATNG